MLNMFFFISLFLLISMIIFKVFEEKNKKKFLFPKLREWADLVAVSATNRTKRFVSIFNGYNGKLLIMFVRDLATESIIGVRRRFIVKKLKFIDSLKIRGDLKKRGSASFFLKNVSEYKKPVK